MRKFFIAVALMLTMILGLTVSTNAATITTYTDESAFIAGLSSFTTYNFDSFSNGGGAWLGGEVLDMQIPGINFDNAIINTGAFGGYYRSATNVVLNQDLVNPIVFTFDAPVFGIGLFNSSVFDAERFQIFDSQNNLLASINLPDQIVNFGGFISDVGIARGVVTPINPTNGSIYIDDLTVGTPVPEPATMFLFGSGLVGLVVYRKRSVIHS